MHSRNFGTRSNNTTGERTGGRHGIVKCITCNGKPSSSPKRLGIRYNTMHKTISEPGPSSGEGSVPSEGRATPPSLTQGTTTPGTGRTEAPPWSHLRYGRKHNVAPYFCVQKDFAPSSSNCRPGRLLTTCKTVGNAPYSSVPQSTWVTSPRHPGGREASEVVSTASLLSRRRQQLRRPARSRRAASPADETEEGPRGRAPSRGSGPAQPAHLPLPGPARSPRPPAPEPVGRPGSGFHHGEEAAAPRASGGREGRNPGAIGRAAPPSRARQDAWGLVRPAHPRGGGLTGPGRGPPPKAGRIQRGPRPGAGGGRVPAAGRAGRPAGGRRVAAAPGLK